jgi:hypothetical protein
MVAGLVYRIAYQIINSVTGAEVMNCNENCSVRTWLPRHDGGRLPRQQGPRSLLVSTSAMKKWRLSMPVGEALLSATKDARRYLDTKFRAPDGYHNMSFVVEVSHRLAELVGTSAGEAKALLGSRFYRAGRQFCGLPRSRLRSTDGLRSAR